MAVTYNRVILLVLDGCGVGIQDDYQKYHNIRTNTIGSLYKDMKTFQLPFLESWGLLEILGKKSNIKINSEGILYGKMQEKTAGNDTFAGLWEMFGITFSKRFLSNEKKLSPILMEKIRNECRISTLCNEYLSGYKAFDKYFYEHKKTGNPILYLSDDGVLLLAAHQEILDTENLNLLAQKIQSSLFGLGFVRIITRPFYGDLGNFIRDESLRKDFLLVDVPPNKIVLDLTAEGYKVRITEHLARIFGYPHGADVLQKKYKNNQELLSIIEEDSAYEFNLQVYVVPDTDSLGHKKDVQGFGKKLKEFDRWLKKYVKSLQKDDLLIVTADHGCDPTSNLRGHCREFVPLFVFSKSLTTNAYLGTRNTFADLGQTISRNFGLRRLKIGNTLEIF